MSEFKARLEEYMNSISRQIRSVEADLQDVWFDVAHEGLEWAPFEDDGRRRLVYDGRPLIEHKFSIREQQYKIALDLAAIAAKAMEERFIEVESLGNK